MGSVLRRLALPEQMGSVHETGSYTAPLSESTHSVAFCVPSRGLTTISDPAASPVQPETLMHHPDATVSLVVHVEAVAVFGVVARIWLLPEFHTAILSPAGASVWPWLQTTTSWFAPSLHDRP